VAGVAEMDGDPCHGVEVAVGRCARKEDSHLAKAIVYPTSKKSVTSVPLASHQSKLRSWQLSMPNGA
jgi:hypothetical protein